MSLLVTAGALLVALAGLVIGLVRVSKRGAVNEDRVDSLEEALELEAKRDEVLREDVADDDAWLRRQRRRLRDRTGGRP